MYKLLTPLLSRLDPETTHMRMIGLGEALSRAPFTSLLDSMYGFNDPSLETNVFGIHFRNPVGTAAGFDKYARLVDLLPHLNFGFMEAGSITAQMRSGNAKPRMFRLEADHALINRMGLNNDGADATFNRLKERKFLARLGINIAKTHDPAILGDKAIEDFIYSFKKLYPIGDYISLNISCPNTAEGKTFEDREPLLALLTALKPIREAEAQKKPVLLKVSPNISLEMLETILGLGEQFSIDGYILCNGSPDRDNVKTSTEQLKKIGVGGISGDPIRDKTTELIRHAYKQLKRPCIIGLGGIASAQNAYDKIRAGASLIQMYTGIVFEGPGLAKQISKGLAEFLKRDGFKNITEAVGTSK